MSVPDSELTTLLLDSIRSVFKGIATLPTSPDVRALAKRALECERGVKGWELNPPTRKERAEMLKMVLRLHWVLGTLQK